MASTLVYYAQQDYMGYPIPGTMMAVKSISDVPANTQVINPGVTLSPAPPAHPAGLKYYVRLSKSGSIIPNSLIATIKKPSGNVAEVQFQPRNL